MSKKILLADDSITIQKVIELTFSDEDFEVVTVGNGRLAIERVQDVRPDLVLCDIIMPEKDGYQVCEFIKKNSALSRTPVLLLTGAFEPFDQELAARVGCDGFLAKPFEPQTLIAKVKDLLGKAGADSAAAPAAAPAPTPAAEPRAASASTSEAEPYAFVPEPPRAYEAPSAPVPFEEAGVSFFTDETLEERPETPKPANTAAPRPETIPVPTFPETPDFEEYRGSAFDDVAPAASAAAPPPRPAPSSSPAATSTATAAPAVTARPAAGRSGFPALDEEDGPQTLLHVSADEMATLRGDPARPTPPPPPPPGPPPPPTPAASLAPAASPAGSATRPPARAPLWTQQTMEVSLEARARASKEPVQRESEPVFEEMFDPAPVPPKPAPAPPVVAAPPAVAAPPVVPPPASVPAPPMAAAAAPSATPTPPTPAPAPPPAPSVAAAAAPVAAVSAKRLSPDDPATLSVQSGKDGSGVATPSAGAPGSAAGVSVPVDMVSQIAQRVVAQISEKVIREVAWEVIPDLAEVLIKKEIERLKAELQRT